MKKRILSIVLAVLMLVSVLPISALAAEESVVPQNVVTAEHGGVKVEKRAEWTDEENGKAKITFTLTGGTMTSQDIPVTDIVLVIDKSASMSKNGSPKMNNAKKAAVSFVTSSLARVQIRATRTRCGLQSFPTAVARIPSSD